jgi:hypothetical protein
MERMENESINNEFNPEVLGKKFNTDDFMDFVAELRQKIKANPSVRLSIVANWVDVNKARAAKALMDQYASRLNIDSITIRATRQQYEEDVNAFESGVKWEEI